MTGGLPASRVSRAMTAALRHAPQRLGLRLDPAGWVGLDALAVALRSRGGPWRTLGVDDLLTAIAASTKPRYELRDGRVRARYGHSAGLEVAVAAEPAEPPVVLLHGTARSAAGRILAEGLRPGRRQYVHLTADRADAVQVGRRHGEPVVLAVDARRAAQAGVRFRPATATLWLADPVPPRFIAVDASRPGR